MSVACIVAILVGVLSYRCVELYAKNSSYAEKEAALQEQLEYEQDREEEIAEYEDYVTTDAYIIEMARKKLGLVFEGETVFREADQ